MALNFLSFSPVLLVCGGLAIFTAVFVQKSWHPDMAFFEDYFKSRVLPGEFMPDNKEMTVSLKDFVYRDEAPPLWWSDVQGVSIRQPVPIKPRKLEFDVSMPRDGDVSFRQFYFPGWEATLVSKVRDRTALPVHAAEPYGQLSVSLPKGEYVLVLRLTMLPAEKIGMALSIAGLLILLGVGLWPRQKVHASQ